MSEQLPDAELNALAESLARLRPAPPALDRDALMFRAGRAAAARGWGWPLATAATSLLALGLAAVLVVRPEPRTVERTVIVRVPVKDEPLSPKARQDTPSPEATVPVSAPSPAEWPEPTSEYFHMQEHLLRWGLDGLKPPSPPPQNLSRRDMLKSL